MKKVSTPKIEKIVSVKITDVIKSLLPMIRLNTL